MLILFSERRRNVHMQLSTLCSNGFPWSGAGLVTELTGHVTFVYSGPPSLHRSSGSDSSSSSDSSDEDSPDYSGGSHSLIGSTMGASHPERYELYNQLGVSASSVHDSSSSDESSSTSSSSSSTTSGTVTKELTA